MDLCGVPLPKVTLDGRTLLPIIKSAKTPAHHEVMHWQWQSKWAVRKGDWKLLGRANKAEFLGNLAGAKPEQKNYLKEKPQLAEELKRLHDDWAASVQPSR